MTNEELQAALNDALIEVATLELRVRSLTAEVERTRTRAEMAETEIAVKADIK